jgi:hypothetical protein
MRDIMDMLEMRTDCFMRLSLIEFQRFFGWLV